MSSTSFTTPLPGGVPSGYTEHTESQTTILLPTDRSAFLNPPQQFNRDLSVAVIRAWNERRKEELEAKWRASQLKKGKDKLKRQEKPGEGRETVKAGLEEEEATNQPVAGPSTERAYKAPGIKILEGLSATGLRSIRYAKEIPDVKYVLANDLSPSACDAMRMNVAYNGVGEDHTQLNGHAEVNTAGGSSSGAKEELNTSNQEEKEKDANVQEELPNGRRAGCEGKVKVNEGDACTLMYTHRDPKARVDVVDLDPYGTAAPFIDAALGCISDGGLLCVTCTDVAVMAGSQFPEKSFANYGGASVNAEYCHEVALRLVLNSIATTAARYGRYIVPVLSLSIDFYVRVFVTVHSGAIQVKDLSSHTGIVHVCTHCQTYELQPFGRSVEKTGSKGGVHKLYKSAQTSQTSYECEHCESKKRVGGPMWLGPIQDREFAERALKSIEGQQEDYGTWTRMHGMLSLAKEELDDPFYFTCNKVGSFMKCSSAPTHTAVSALLNAGYAVSRSHAAAGSVKTNAPRSFILDIFREWQKSTPVRIDKIADGNPAKIMISKPMTHEVDLTPHPDTKKFEKGEKVVFYQTNPLPNWGPAARAKTKKSTAGQEVGEDATAVADTEGMKTAGSSVKRASEEVLESEAKKVKVEDVVGGEEVAERN